MVICKNCGVELEEGMEYCPLCGQPVNANYISRQPVFNPQQPLIYSRKMTAPQKKFTWEIISLILLSAIAATFIIDFIINRKITWSEYPAALSFVVFSYVSIFAFSQRNLIIQLVVGFVLSSACMIALDAITGSINWSLKLAVPMLLAGNIILAALLTIIRISKHKGINLLAWAFLGAALFCVCQEGILSYYRFKAFYFTWSVIVSGCIIPVVLVLLFVHFRLKKGRSLKKTFHI